MSLRYSLALTLLICSSVVASRTTVNNQEIASPDTEPKTTEEKARIGRHANLQVYAAISPRRDLLALLRDSPNRTIKVAFRMGAMVNSATPIDFSQWLSSHVCESSAIIVGEVVRHVCGLTRDRGKVFSDYYIRVGQTIYSSPSASSGLTAGQHIVLTRTGGALRLSEGAVSTDFEGLSELELKHHYLLFLKSIADVDYRPTDLGASFDLIRDSAPQSTYEPTQQMFKGTLSGLTAQSLLDKVKAAVADPDACKPDVQ